MTPEQTQEKLDKANHFIKASYDAVPNGFVVRYLAGNTKAVEVTNSTLTFEIVIPDTMNNPMGSVHGGAIATIIDELTTIAHYILNGTMLHVSTNLSVSYVSAIRQGDTILCECVSRNVGKTLLFSTAYIYRKTPEGARGQLLAFGKHTKFSMEPKL
ncbi:HotDog domain-containing protein [Obelidium mucronatum]|nr:HotDog domain-containing protein [Obelidium mucronatum]